MQWNIILVLAFALVIAAFAIVNMDTVTINYLFGEASVPLILIIIGFTLAGALMIVFFNIANQVASYRKIKALRNEIVELQNQLDQYELDLQAKSNQLLDVQNENSQFTKDLKEDNQELIYTDIDIDDSDKFENNTNISDGEHMQK